MPFKSIATIVTDLEIDGAALAAAIELARRDDAHLDVLCLGIDRTQPGFYYAGANAMAMQTGLAEAESDARAIEQSVEEKLGGTDIVWAARALAAPSPGLAQFLAYHMRFADIAVLSRPYGKNRGHENEAIVESALFDAGIPVMVIPDDGALPASFGRGVIAWNESPEALRAVRAALPLLQGADVVNIAIIDPPAHAPNRSDPGGALSQMLSRHGVHAEVSVLAKTLPRVSDVIARHLDDQKADFLVMGAYGHSRFRESILGGATRSMLQQASMPVFMVH